MKKRISKRILAGILTFGMAASLMPATAFAATDVDVDPGSGTLPVEYFSSTLYNWDEDAANAAAAAADQGSYGTIYQGNQYAYSTIAPSTSNDYQSTDYWYRSGNDYYRVYYIYTQTGNWWSGYNDNYELYYQDSSGEYQLIGQTDDGSTEIYLYRTTVSMYEGKGFYFTSAGNQQNAPSFSKWVGYGDSDGIAKQNYYIYSGLAEKYLDDSENAPFSNDNVNAPQLFDTDGNSYTTVYNNVKVPFVYDEETGYYELNSDKWAVYFNSGNASSDGTMSIADKPVSFNTGSGRDPMCGFQPFEDVSSNTQNAYYGTSPSRDDQTGYNGSYSLEDGNGGATYGFGMVTSVNFQMSDDGLDSNGNPIEFSFSGDDDVWVYVDGVLALDIGGTHDAITGTIDFSTGDVTLTAEKYGKIGDKSTDSTLSNPSQGSLSQTNLYTALGTTRTGFASQGQHTLTIYYMDRGRGATNCLIKFNLPQRDTVSVTKEITQSKDDNGNTSPLTDAEQASANNVNFGFTLYEGDTSVANKTYNIYQGDRLIGQASTNSSGHFTLRNGQTARFNVDISEDGKEYHVVEDSTIDAGYTEPEYTYSSNISGVDVPEKSSGFTSQIVSASGSSTATDTISFVCENFLDANLPNPGAALADDSYVIDYGLPVKIENVMSNDIWRGEEAKVTSVVETGEDGEPVADAEKYGEAALNDDGSITYTLTKQLDRVVSLEYTVEVTGTGNSGNTETTETIEKTANIYIIPATSMYYEENFSDMITYKGNLEWQDEKDGNEYGAYQEEGEVGNPNDSTYGTDTVYLSNVGDSYGTSKHVTANGYATQFSYDFTGTGTAIYSRISQDSAYIRVEITQDGKNVDRQYIDTRMLGEVAANQTLYNIPVYNNSGLEHGTYTATVTIYKAGTPVNGTVDGDGNLIEGTDKSGAEFYLDGIRVYQPLVDDDRAESAYASDNESNIALINIRSKIAADGEIGLSGDSFTTLTDVNDNIIDPSEYSSIGPNEELYLNNGNYSVSFFLLNWDSQSYNLYLGLKTPGNTAATVQVGSETITLNNSADCYYDVSDYVTVEMIDLDEDEVPETALGTLTITNANGLVSLTNIKVTGVDQFDIGYSNDLDGDNVDAQTLYLLPSNYFSNKDSSEEETDQSTGDTTEEQPDESTEGTETPDQPTEDVTEETPEAPADDVTAFEPEYFEIHVNYAKLTKKATVNVASSKDVAYITIDGERVDPGTAGSTNSFALSFKKVTKGTTYEIIAYNTDGVASETYTAVAE